MTARTRSRTFLVAAAVAALTAPLALVAALGSPATAANVGPRPHEVNTYKVEKHVDLSGEHPDNYADEDLWCNDGDIALDGMWRVDHVDQFNPSDYDPDDPEVGYYNDERDVVVYASYPDSGNERRWRFRLENLSQGNAQVKLFVTCIRGRTEQNAQHAHNLVATSVRTDTSHHVLPVGQNQVDFDDPCPVGYYPVAPGFDFHDDDYNEIFRSWPAAGGGWSWGFKIAQVDPDLDVYLRCLRKTVDLQYGPGASKPHKHKIPMVFRYYDTTVSPHNRSVERRFDCDQGAGNYHNYKAMVGAFAIVDPAHLWFLGMDPRPKQRAFRFWYNNSGSNQVYLGALCIRSRTDKQIK